MKTIKSPIWISIIWIISIGFQLIGATVLMFGLFKLVFHSLNACVSTVALIYGIVQFVLACLFSFQAYLFRLAFDLSAKTKKVSLQTFAFALIYGMAGADLFFRGLRDSTNNFYVVESVETYLGCLTIIIWIVCMVLHKNRNKDKGESVKGAHPLA